MRKLSVIGIMIALGTGFAVASSLAIPWFVDVAPIANAIPGKASGTTGLVTLKNNEATTMVCYITYYNQDGAKLGPFPPNNSFTVAPQSSLAFRPVEVDPGLGTNVPGYPVGLLGGQEGAQGVQVPDRPRSINSTTPIPGTGGVIDEKRNGSCVIEWFGGGPQSIQGTYAQFQTVIESTGAKTTMSYGHLLPPGI